MSDEDLSTINNTAYKIHTLVTADNWDMKSKWKVVDLCNKILNLSKKRVYK